MITCLESSVLRDRTFCDAYIKNLLCKLNELTGNENIFHARNMLRHVFMNIVLSNIILGSA